MNNTISTISIYEGLETVKKCFEALGETGEVLKNQFIPALNGMIETQKIVAETNARIQAAYKKAGMGYNGNYVK